MGKMKDLMIDAHDALAATPGDCVELFYSHEGFFLLNKRVAGQTQLYTVYIDENGAPVTAKLERAKFDLAKRGRMNLTDMIQDLEEA